MSNNHKSHDSIFLFNEPVFIFLDWSYFSGEKRCPENAKTVSVIPLDKGKLNTNEISNFRPMSALNTFFKIYERVIKDQIVCDIRGVVFGGLGEP